MKDNGEKKRRERERGGEGERKRERERAIMIYAVKGGNRKKRYQYEEVKLLRIS